MKKKITIFLLSLVILCSAAFTQEQKSIAVATFDVTGNAVMQDEADAITELFISELVATSKISVVDRTNFDKLIKEMKFQASDWSDSAKTTALGNAANAQLISRGQIIKLGSKLYLSSSIIDAKNAKVLSSAREQFDSLDDVFGLLETFAKNIVASLPLEIGDIGPGCGIIFYYSEAGFPVYESDDASPAICHYLECSLEEFEGMVWCPCGLSDFNTTYKKWCDVKTMEGIGTGKLNTIHIINYRHYGIDSLTPSNCAAYACTQYFTETTKPGDWYLPSTLELHLIYENLTKNGKILPYYTYHSSSQYGTSNINFNNLNIWTQNFNDGNHSRSLKSSRIGVRAVRAF